MKRLPAELCRIIAHSLVRECAVITAQELAGENGAGDSVVNLSHDVYVRYDMIYGIRYIGSLRNSLGRQLSHEKTSAGCSSSA